MRPTIPFLWNYVKKVEIPNSQSGGQERIITKSVAEENSPSFIQIYFKKFK